jgi:type I restriction enzyme M protein
MFGVAFLSFRQHAVMLRDCNEATLHIGIRCGARKFQIFDRAIPIFPCLRPITQFFQRAYLIFIKRLDEMQELEERKATTLGKPIERRIFPEGKDERGESYANLRWSRFKHFAGPEMFRIVDEHVFPFIRTLNGQGTAYARHMRDARFQIPGPALLAKVVDKIDMLDMGDRDTKGDVYEYMLAKIATAGQNGQFRC